MTEEKSDKPPDLDSPREIIDRLSMIEQARAGLIAPEIQRRVNRAVVECELNHKKYLVLTVKLPVAHCGGDYETMVFLCDDFSEPTDWNSMYCRLRCGELDVRIVGDIFDGDGYEDESDEETT